MMEYPDSALAVLDAIDRDLLTTERLKANHALLHAMALDKNYVDVSDDSLASIAVSYYSKKGPDMYEARALYYLGLSYYYAQDYKKAILEFTKAEKVARRSDSLYWAFAKAAQADAYAKTHNDVEEYNCLILSDSIFSSLPNAEYYKSANTLRLAQSLYKNGDEDGSEQLLSALILNAETTENIKVQALSNFAVLKNNSSNPDFETVIKIYDHVLSKYNGRYMSRKDYWIYAYALNKSGRRNESGNIVDQLLCVDTSGTADYWMYMMEKSEGNSTEALKYLEKSTNKIDKEVTAALQQSLALSQRDYYESQYRNAEYKAHIRKLLAISVTIASLLSLVMVLWGVSVYVRHQREEKEYYLNYAEEIRRQLEASRNDNYPELKRKYLEICKSRFELIGSLYEEYVLHYGKKNAEHSIYAKVSEIINGFINDNTYKKQLESVIDESLDGIISKLRKEMPRLKEVDYSIFSFIIVGFDATTISHLLNISMNVVYIRKSRMKQRIEDANPEHKERYLEILA